jgi:hypothetical protein
MHRMRKVVLAGGPNYHQVHPGGTVFGVLEPGNLSASGWCCQSNWEAKLFNSHPVHLGGTVFGVLEPGNLSAPGLGWCCQSNWKAKLFNSHPVHLGGTVVSCSILSNAPNAKSCSSRRTPFDPYLHAVHCLNQLHWPSESNPPIHNPWWYM